MVNPSIKRQIILPQKLLKNTGVLEIIIFQEVTKSRFFEAIVGYHVKIYNTFVLTLLGLNFFLVLQLPRSNLSIKNGFSRRLSGGSQSGILTRKPVKTTKENLF